MATLVDLSINVSLRCVQRDTIDHSPNLLHLLKIPSKLDYHG